MDDKSQSGIPVDQSQQSVSQPVTQPVQQAPSHPVGSVHKEQGPIAEQASTHEVMQPADVEPQLHPEVQEAGVEIVRQEPQLTARHHTAGVLHAKESIPHPTAPAGTVQIAMSEQEAMQTIKKHKKVKDALYWIALAARRHYLKAREWLKVQ